MIVHRMSIRISPAKKAAVPFAFCLRAKKRRVFWGPMMMVRPMRKRIYSRSGVSNTIEGSMRGWIRTFPMASLSIKN